MLLSFLDRRDRAVATALCQMECPMPVTVEAKDEIRRRVFDVLRIKPEWVPDVHFQFMKSNDFGVFTVDTLRFESWKGMFGDASLFMPKHAKGPVPVMLFTPGHAMLLGRFKGTYQIVSRILAEQGVAVLLFDLFGLGGRAQTGHRQNFDVFGCGTTICGLMILEAIGLYNALEKDPRFDQKRMGLIGHSGGGQNSIFLSASLYDRVALTVCSGWACSYEYGARKARYICECNLFPGILHEFETWHALGCMFPKPLLICSGNDDSMIARDVVLNLKARMESIYGGNPNLETYIWAGSHPWAGKAFRHVSNFVLRHFGMDEVDENVPPPPPPFPECLDAEQAPLPADCLDLVALAERLTGKPQTGASRLEDVFPAPPFLTTEEFDSLTPEWRDIMVRNSLFL